MPKGFDYITEQDRETLCILDKKEGVAHVVAYAEETEAASGGNKTLFTSFCGETSGSAQNSNTRIVSLEQAKRQNIPFCGICSTRYAQKKR